MAIDRYNLVTRHNPEVTEINAYAPLTVGNGEFAYTADITGLQTFPDAYADGIPLCTQSQWGWHIRPADNKTGRYDINDLSLEMFDTKTRKVGYRTEPKSQEEAYNWLRMNPHRLHLGRIGLDITKKNGSPVGGEDLRNAHQKLDLWRGLLQSSFEVEDNSIRTYTCCHPKKDMVSFLVESELFSVNQLTIDIKLPYGSPLKTAADWDNDAAHDTEILSDGEYSATLRHKLDNDICFIKLKFSEGAKLVRTGKNSFTIRPAPGATKLELSCLFSARDHNSPQPLYDTSEDNGAQPLFYADENNSAQPLFDTNESNNVLPLFDGTRTESERYWHAYWNNGGAIEFKNSTDPRAMELERRVVLSQYLMAVNCAGSLPPQETGLTFNSWYGKFHLEMHWWHGVHFPVWGRPALFEKSLDWYTTILPVAEELAQSQGYAGVRWPKMVAYDGIDSPSPIGPLLIWQQPHPIYYAELLYKTHPNRETLEQFKKIVFKTAEFMASYAEYNETQNRYNLGPALIPAQENHKPQDTLNPTLELEYWAFGLNTANEWKKRLNLKPVAEWTKVADGLAPLPVQDGVYLAHERCPDTFTRFNIDHPSMVYAFGILPGIKADKEIMRNTLRTVLEKWRLDETWGWDFPMMAMTAARLGEPKIAVDCLLMDAPKNEYLRNGHNKQADRKDLPIYLPGNGGLLTAVAMMAAGWEGCSDNAPGFPKDGSWCVVWEGLKPVL